MTHHSFLSAANALSANIQQYVQPVHLNRLSMQQNPDKTWEERIVESIAILTDVHFIQPATTGENYLVAYYKDEDTPIGIARQTKEATITAIVTHPGSSGVGGCLMREAASFSEKKGNHGKLSLVTSGEQAINSYQALGFSISETYRGTDFVKMTLNPCTSDRWQKNEYGKWHLLCRSFSPKKSKSKKNRNHRSTP